MNTTSWFVALVLGFAAVAAGCEHPPTRSGIYVVACATTGEDTYAWDNDNDGALEADCLLPPAYQDCNDSSPEVGLAPLQYPDCDNDNQGDAGATPVRSGCGLVATFDCDQDAPSGVTNNDDCDDTRADVYYGAPELCDGLDNNCVGGQGTSEVDTDGDGVLMCAGDCNDADLGVHVGAQELCDLQDNNCNGEVDEGSDLDGDTFTTCGAGAVGTTDCDDTSAAINPGAEESCGNRIDDNCDGDVDSRDNDGDGYNGCDNEQDCDDGDASVNAGTSEVCNGADDNCDGQVDEGTKTTYYADGDGDGYGDAGTFTYSCDWLGSPWVENSDDCDDTNSDTYSGAPEICDGRDNNCDGTVTAEEDNSDNDGYRVCDEDCDDTNSDTYPGAPEICDGQDNNCDGSVSDESQDADGDGYTACPGPGTSSDCDDSDPNVNPGAPEDCDGKDTNCDGTIPNSESDADGDNFRLCAGDCDDTMAAIHPSAVELCDGLDNNCDAQTDENLLVPLYLDDDHDSYGAGTASEQCPEAGGYSARDGDCDDTNASINPGAQELCDYIDNNCDGSTDEGLTDTPYFLDSDGDGAGSASDEILGCDSGPPDGYVADGMDCDDDDNTIYPGAIELCEEDVIDQDCDGNDDEGFLDVDGDGTCLEWIYLPPITFPMGSPPEEIGREPDESLHAVQLTHGFFMLNTEFTIGMYNRFMEPNRQPVDGECTDSDGENTCPLNNISWDETLDVANTITAACNEDLTCRVLSSAFTAMANAYNTADNSWIDPDGGGPMTRYEQTGYRLPTEAEWEYAVRAGLDGSGEVETIADAFYGGEITSVNSCGGSIDPVMAELGWFTCNAPLCDGTPCASPVATDPLSGGSRSFPETELGLYDLSGNLWEWVWDTYTSYPNSGLTLDPASDSGGNRVIRGGAYDTQAGDCRSASRGQQWPEASGASANVGFRLVRSAIPDPVP